MRSKASALCTMSVCLLASGPCMGNNPILEALVQQGATPVVIPDEQLAAIKGAAMRKIVNMPAPSVTMGIREHLVTYKRFGRYEDYSSYRYVGFSYSPQASHPVKYQGEWINTFGDIWLADKYSSAYQWKRVNASPIEYHLQAVDQNNRLLPFGLRESIWNRPISKFSW